ncbi:MAG: heavy metal response regulator transcription factor [Candidatus Omnitrophica bacterium]|nr:heavy metal response regulator transcription factor [Candidatus Omnitrophota bacterium]
MRVLVIEDEAKVARFVKKGLLENNFAVDIAPDGEEGLFLAQNEKYDLIVLDLMLPKLDGLELLKKLRKEGKDTPVICLTAKGRFEDRIKGFNAGTDDYLVKPFRFAELLARLRAILRRSTKEPKSAVLEYADLILDQRTRQAKRRDRIIVLTAKEYAILELLMRNAEEIVTRTMITESAWDYNFDFMSNVVDVHIRRLREKVDEEERIKLIHTVRGMGYVLKKESS